MKARRLEPKDLKPADLIFIAKAGNPNKIVHVALYAGREEMMEWPQTGERIRKISFQKKFGVSLNEMKDGMRISDRVIYFGTLFMDEE
jgi:cell wall-associated NlpC family hydrolase